MCLAPNWFLDEGPYLLLAFSSPHEAQGSLLHACMHECDSKHSNPTAQVAVAAARPQQLPEQLPGGIAAKAEGLTCWFLQQHGAAVLLAAPSAPAAGPADAPALHVLQV